MITILKLPFLFILINLQALVEFDDTGWKSRERIKVHDVFYEFIVEHNLAWVPREDLHHQTSQSVSWPALVSAIINFFLYFLQ